MGREIFFAALARSEKENQIWGHGFESPGEPLLLPLIFWKNGENLRKRG